MPVEELKLVERNTWNHVACPNCGRLHQTEDRNGPIELPQRCQRTTCRCPLEPKAANAFIEGRAEAEADASITAAAQKLRGEVTHDDRDDRIARLEAQVEELLKAKK